MYKNVFLDANVIADIYDSSRPSYSDSKRVMHLLSQDKKVRLFTSCDIITTLYYILSKQDKARALDAILEINELCSVVEFGNAEVLKSCKLMKKNTLYKDLEDTIQYVMAQKTSCQLILSNDKGFASEDILLMSSKAFLEQKEI
jgi:predicted nucleic acid-binding protein